MNGRLDQDDIRAKQMKKIDIQTQLNREENNSIHSHNLSSMMQLEDYNLAHMYGGSKLASIEGRKVEVYESSKRSTANKFLKNSAIDEQMSQPTISDKKVWAISGMMMGQTSKKFIRQYKVGRYKKIQSLKEDMEFLASPHHEQKHMGNMIFPFSNGQKSRLHTAGSFDYRKYIAIQNESKLHKQTPGHEPPSQIRQREDMKGIYSPRSVSKHVISQLPIHAPSQQMEIRYINIVSKPLLKRNNFLDNKQCPHSMTNLRHSQTNNHAFAFPSASASTSSPANQYQLASNSYQSRKNSYSSAMLSNNQLQCTVNPYQSIVNPYFNQIDLPITNSHSSISTPSRLMFLPSNPLSSKSQSRSTNRSSIQRSKQLRLPEFATVSENITLLSKAKQNLVTYVNQIGIQDDPLKNAFVTKPNFI